VDGVKEDPDHGVLQVSKEQGALHVLRKLLFGGHLPTGTVPVGGFWAEGPLLFLAGEGLAVIRVGVGPLQEEGEALDDEHGGRGVLLQDGQGCIRDLEVPGGGRGAKEGGVEGNLLAEEVEEAVEEGGDHQNLLQAPFCEGRGVARDLEEGLGELVGVAGDH